MCKSIAVVQYTVLMNCYEIVHVVQMEKIFHTPKNFYKHIFKSNYTVPVKRFKAISKAKKDRLPFLTVMTDAGMSVSVQSCWWTA